MADAENYGPRLEKSTYAMVAVSLFFMLLRFGCKARYGKRFGLDDLLLAISWVLLGVYAGVIIAAMKHGLGRHMASLPHESIVMAHKLMATADFFIIISIAISKSSFAVTLLRLALEPWHKILVWGVIVTVNLFMWLSAIFIFCSCAPIESIWDDDLPGTCWDARMLLNFNIFTGGWSAAMDFVLALFPWFLIWRLNMQKMEKIGVCIAMSLGILSGVTATIKTTYIEQSAERDDWTWLSLDLLIWSGAEIAVVITAASIPFLRLALREVANSSSSRGGGPGSRALQLGYISNYKSGAGGTRDQTTVVGGADAGTGANKQSDNRSDESILSQANDGGINKTQTVIVEYYHHESGSRGDVESQRSSREHVTFSRD
ncbi:hypothetical protein QBC46DRAFT_339149 [Diplogelasinospora grovesii]|uniref:Rhodopsin domain-containing protein n=1 Tax=Diplogelasinospora grovesii TaxID=303347 RepID=A0AAN6NFR6_9PEZI|nr:hypothetical protein QBC46DRAFT_339149 [Diplogelasinospora grovesii]